jgi:hypothetical protein
MILKYKNKEMKTKKIERKSNIIDENMEENILSLKK